MAGIQWLAQLTLVTLNTLLVVVFVLANRDYCGSVFETQVGEYHNFSFCELFSLKRLTWHFSGRYFLFVSNKNAFIYFSFRP